jgi:pimeloyl-ACP methyl ester carboxylesterase
MNRFDSLSPEARAGIMRNARSIEALSLSSDSFPVLYREDIKRLRVPTLVVTGANTIQIHKLVDAELTRLLPNVKRVTIATAAHGSPRENSSAFNEAVLAFLVGDSGANWRATNNRYRLLTRAAARTSSSWMRLIQAGP